MGDVALDTKELLYYNGFGGFSKDGKEYIIKTNEQCTPAPWSHLMANPEFGTIVTCHGGGYTWAHNSRENKLTTWCNDPVEDKPSEKIWLEKEDGDITFPFPYDSLVDFEIRFGFGYAIFQRKTAELKLTSTIYVPITENKKVVKLSIENGKEDAQKFKIYYLLDVVLGVAKEFTNQHLVFEKVAGGVKVHNAYRENYQEENVAILGFIEKRKANWDVSVNKDNEVTLSTDFLIEPHQTLNLFFEIYFIIGIFISEIFIKKFSRIFIFIKFIFF